MNSRILHFCALACLCFFSCKKNPSEATGPLFELLPAEQTGIHFKNLVNENFQNNLLTNDYIYAGGGVSIDDLNNDGLPDIVFISNEDKPSIYINKGDFNFLDISETAGIPKVSGWSSGVHIIDINQDGHKDIYICRGGEHIRQPIDRKNLLYVNDGNLKFTEQAAKYGIDDPGATTMAAFFDYDLDGDLDLYTMNVPIDYKKPNRFSEMLLARTNPSIIENATYDSDNLFRNDGSKFTKVTAKAGIANRAYGLGISIGDVNEDGFPDIYITNDFDIDNYYYLNNGDGTFTESLTKHFPHVSFFAMGVDMADFNNDGHLDVFEVEMLPEKRKRAVLNMAPMERTKFELLNAYGQAPQYMRNSLQMNRGNGYFTDVAQYAEVNKTDWSWGTRLVDLDDDGFKDIYVANGIERDMKDRDFQRSGNTISQQSDGKLSVEQMNSLVPSNPIMNYAYKNKGNLKFEKVSEKWGFDFKGFSNAVATVDLDLDGDLDLVVSNTSTTPLIYKNNSRERGQNYLNIEFRGEKNNPQGIGAKVLIETDNGIQFEDQYPVAGFQSSSEPIIHFGLAKTTKINKATITWPDGKEETLTNIPANQRIIADYKNAKEPSSSLTSVKSLLQEKPELLNQEFDHIESYYDDFKSEILLPHKMSQHGPKLAAGDVNNDGLEDFYIGGAAKQAGTIYLQSKDGKFSARKNNAMEADKKYEDIGSIFFDADGDEDLDLYVVSGSNEFEKQLDMYQDRLYLNDGKGNFSLGLLPKITSSGSCVTASDYDNDGDLDLFVGGRVVPQKYPTNPRSYLLENQNGSFIDVTESKAKLLAEAGMVTDAVWSDIDKDGDQDLMVVGEWMGIELWKNQDGTLVKSSSEIGLENTEGWWNSVAAMDIDGDGDDDFVVGNIGLNHKFKASKEKPFQVYSNDFDKTGTYDIVLAFYQDDEVFPVRGRDCSSEQMPFLTEKFPDFESFGDANLIDVYGEELDKSLHKVAKEFASVILINEGGKFGLKKLPLDAQLSSVNGAIFEDINGDNKKEIILVGNMFKTEAETSQADGSIGTVIEIDDQYHMKSMSVKESGFFAAGDAKDITLVNGVSNKYILVANNHGKLQLFSVKK